MGSFLVIQSASIGDVILMTPVLESIHNRDHRAAIDILVKKGNESLFNGHPFIRNIHSWDKSKRKYRDLLRLVKVIRGHKYDYVFNIQRFASTGLLTVFSGARNKIGFRKNPFSAFYTSRVEHVISLQGNTMHEVERNLELVRSAGINGPAVPRLYPSGRDEARVAEYSGMPFITIAPASLWFTKQYPAGKWIEFINEVPETMTVYLTGSAQDKDLCQRITETSVHPHILVLAGELTLLQTAALMKKARMNYTNDSAPQHLASAVDAPVSSIFCSTVPAFGFGPVASDSFVIETGEKLDCRPCGLHGRNDCPEKHFKCAFTISTKQLLERINK
jgi:heptosyltransferase-2